MRTRRARREPPVFFTAEAAAEGKEGEKEDRGRSTRRDSVCVRLERGKQPSRQEEEEVRRSVGKGSKPGRGGGGRGRSGKAAGKQSVKERATDPRRRRDQKQQRKKKAEGRRSWWVPVGVVSLVVPSGCGAWHESTIPGGPSWRHALPLFPWCGCNFHTQTHMPLLVLLVPCRITPTILPLTHVPSFPRAHACRKAKHLGSFLLVLAAHLPSIASSLPPTSTHDQQDARRCLGHVPLL